MKTEVISFQETVKELRTADLVVIRDMAGDRAVADTLTWEDESNETSDLIVGAEGWDDVYLTYGESVVREGHVLKPHGARVVLELYEAKK